VFKRKSQLYIAFQDAKDWPDLSMGCFKWKIDWGFPLKTSDARERIVGPE